MIPSDGHGSGVDLDASDKNVSGENSDTADVWHYSLSLHILEDQSQLILIDPIMVMVE